MLVRTNEKKNGEVIYQNVFTGIKGTLHKQTGRKKGRLPDIAKHYLTEAPQRFWPLNLRKSIKRY